MFAVRFQASNKWKAPTLNHDLLYLLEVRNEILFAVIKNFKKAFFSCQEFLKIATLTEIPAHVHRNDLQEMIGAHQFSKKQLCEIKQQY